jgi:hypothetical protein
MEVAALAILVVDRIAIVQHLITRDTTLCIFVTCSGGATYGNAGIIRIGSRHLTLARSRHVVPNDHPVDVTVSGICDRRRDTTQVPVIAGEGIEEHFVLPQFDAFKNCLFAPYS